MRTLLHNPPGLQHEDHIGPLHAREAMRHNNHRPHAPHPLNDAPDAPLGLGVQVRRRLVEEEDLGLAQQRAREGDALALAAGEEDAVRADEGFVGFWERDYEGVDADEGAGGVEARG